MRAMIFRYAGPAISGSTPTSTFGGTPVTTLPSNIAAEQGTVAWMLYTEGTSGRLKFTCVSDDLLTLAGPGSWWRAR